MELSFATGFESGRYIYNTGNQTLSGRSDIDSFISAATRGVLEQVGTGDVFRLAHLDDASTEFPESDGVAVSGTYWYSTSNAYYLQVTSGNEADFNTGYEFSADIQNGNAQNANDFFTQFTANGVSYKVSFNTDVGFSVYNGSTYETLSGTNTTNKTGSTFETVYFKAWIDGDNLYFRMTSSKNPTDIVYLTLTGFTGQSITSIRFNGNIGSGGVDDLTCYLPEAADITQWTTDYNSSTFDFSPQLREVALVAKTGTDENIDFYDPAAPANWTASNVDVETDLSDGSNTTYAEMGTDKVGWVTNTALSSVPITVYNGTPFAVGDIRAVAVHGWQVQDNGGDNIGAQVQATGVDFGSGVGTENQKALGEVAGSNVMLTGFWDMTGLTGSDGSPIATSVADLRGSMSLI